MKHIHRLCKLSMMFLLIASLLAMGTSPMVTEAANKKTVKSVSLKVGKTKVTKKTYKLKRGKSVVIKVQAAPAAAKKAVSFQSSNKKIVTVSKKGKVVGKKNGTAKITVKVRGKNGKVKSVWMKVKVYTPVKKTTVESSEDNSAGYYILNISSYKFHKPTCGSVKNMKASNKRKSTESREVLIKKGYSSCGTCKP